MYEGLFDGLLNELDARRMVEGVELSAEQTDGDPGVLTSTPGGETSGRATCEMRE